MLFLNNRYIDFETRDIGCNIKLNPGTSWQKMHSTKRR
jgi:hypothetical protein